MDIERARQLIGNQDSHSLKMMVKALNMLPALNTPEDEERLAAANLILKHRRSLKAAINKDIKLG
jgi:hypothetical protein